MNGNGKTNAEETKEGEKIFALGQVEKNNGDLCEGILLGKGKKEGNIWWRRKECGQEKERVVQLFSKRKKKLCENYL